MHTTFFNFKNNNLTLKVIIQPAASKDEISGLLGERLKLRLKAPPVEGKANKQLIAYLAKILGVSKSSVSITHGLSNRRKSVKVEGLSKVPEFLLKFSQ